MNEFSVVMPCFIINQDLLTLTDSAIASLGNVFLILVDNGSPIGGGFLREKADIYIRNKENLGFAKAVNQGLKIAQTEYITIANNDIRISPNWQDVTQEVFLGSLSVYSCHFRMTNYDEPFQYGKSIFYKDRERWCTGSFYVIRKNNYFLYDEDYLNSYDDWDLFYRVRKAGFKTAYTDKACYQHNHSFTQQFIHERAENDQRNREYFKQKHGGYAEDLFTQEFPGQMKIPYADGFQL